VPARRPVPARHQPAQHHRDKHRARLPSRDIFVRRLNRLTSSHAAIWCPRGRRTGGRRRPGKAVP